MAEGMEVRRNDELGRYEIIVGTEVAGFTEFQHMSEKVLLFPHTVIDDKFEGRGLASSLVTAALDDVRARGEKIIVTCPYITKWLPKHPEYEDLRA